MGEESAMPAGARFVSTARRKTVLVASLTYVVLLAVIALVWPVSLRGDGTRVVIIGPWTGDVIATACVVASIVLLAIIVFAVPSRRWWWLLLAPLRLLAVAATALGGMSLMIMDESVTPIVSDGCATGYVVTERSFLFLASGTVLRMDGIIGTEVGHTSVDDGHRPFQQQSYIAVTEGDTLRVWNTLESRTGHLSTTSEPSFVLPRLTTETGCGSAGGRDPLATVQPSPTTPADTDSEEGPAPSSVGDSREQAARMAAVTPAAARGAAVDAAGYSSGHAMQEDLRYDGVVRLSARDRTTIDGLLHFSLTAECRIG